MKKRIIAVVLTALIGSVLLSACGASNTADVSEKTEELSVEEETRVDITGSYTYTELAMNGAFEVPWTLTLKEDETYVMNEENPFMGSIDHTGTYTFDGEKVYTSPFDEMPEIVAEFLNDDTSGVFVLDLEAGTFLPDGAGTSAGAQESAADFSNVAYAAISDAQVCDIYLPEGEGEHPVLMVVHGGGFAFGAQDMEIIMPIINAAVNDGYAVVSVDYRKSAEAVFPAAIADVKAAVRFVRAEADTYGFDADHIAIWGESAGAYLSLMTALTPEVADLNGDVTDNADYSSAVSALVTFYAPVEFAAMQAEYQSWGDTTSGKGSFESQFLGVNDIYAEENAVAVAATYWENYVSELPTDYVLTAWIQVGDENDTNVPYMQSVNFAERLGKVIGEENVNFTKIDGAAHEDDAFYTDENLGAILSGLDKIMK